MQRPSPEFRSVQFLICEIFGESFTYICRALYVEAPLRGTNMVAGNQQKYLLPSFATKT